MKTSWWHGNAFAITGPLWGESTGNRCILSQRVSDASFDVFFVVNLNTRLNKHSSIRWFLHAMTLMLMWHCNEICQNWIGTGYTLQLFYILLFSGCSGWLLCWCVYVCFPGWGCSSGGGGGSGSEKQTPPSPLPMMAYDASPDQAFICEINKTSRARNKANLRDLKAATGL